MCAILYVPILSGVDLEMGGGYFIIAERRKILF